ncbi:hypothetical protein [Labrys neptuniae]|uniref:Uncharacterized protein n=1 Tax=Labrys neptuniae TaxID=376174 RepID=A0ABV3PFW3_9HYPH
MKKHQLNPAFAVIKKVGGVEIVSTITGRSTARVYRWTYPKSHGGTGGFIPHEEALKLLDHAKANGISLTASDFFDVSPAAPQIVPPSQERPAA